MIRYSYLLLSLLIILSGCRGTPFDTCGDPAGPGYPTIYLKIVDSAGKDLLSDSTITIDDIKVIKNCSPMNYAYTGILSGGTNNMTTRVLLLAITDPGCNNLTIRWESDGGMTTNIVTGADAKNVSTGKCPTYEYDYYLEQDGSRVEKMNDFRTGPDYVKYFVIKK